MLWCGVVVWCCGEQRYLKVTAFIFTNSILKTLTSLRNVFPVYLKGKKYEVYDKVQFHFFDYQYKHFSV